MANGGLTGRGRRSLASARVVARTFDPRCRPLPDFVVIGAQRSGTTYLYEQLIAHPQVEPPLRKEVQFLTLHWRRGTRWYRSHFPPRHHAGQRTCEASPYYLFHPDAPRRAALALPNTRFVAILREPSARALSHHRHNRANGIEPLGFEEALAAEPERLATDPDGRHHRLYSYVARGLYAEQIRRWRAAVGDRLLVILSDDLFRNPLSTLDQVQAFVGLDRWPPERSDIRAHRSLAPTVAPTTRRRLQETFAAPNRELALVLGRDLSEWMPVGPGDRSSSDTLASSLRPPVPDHHRLEAR
jgi:hypothetical protein